MAGSAMASQLPAHMVFAMGAGRFPGLFQAVLLDEDRHLAMFLELAILQNACTELWRAALWLGSPRCLSSRSLVRGGGRPASAMLLAMDGSVATFGARAP